MPEQTITVTVNQDWIYDKLYKAGETATIPASVYTDVVSKLPELFTKKKD